MTAHFSQNPLTPREMVPDDVLRDLAKISPEREKGELSEEHTTILAMYLPEICGELLAHRLRDDAKQAHHRAERQRFVQSKRRRARLVMDRKGATA